MVIVKKIKYLIVFLILVFFSTEMMSQSRNIIGKQSPPKVRVSKKKEAKTDPIAKLAKSITANSHTDSEKVYAIYNWIATNIMYDTGLRFSKNLQKEIYISEENVVRNVLGRRMALCGGYAFLFRDLCEKVNIPVEVIHGFTKVVEGQSQNYKQPNHTWNAVKLNGRWELLDITWAVGYGNEEKPDNFWYLINPKDFILSHYPQNPQWTLLGESVSFTEFKKR